jgi:surfactin synthase thioesterase subunit
MRLFCFPYAGGGASIYGSWASALPPEVELVAVQLPGRESRLSEKPFSDLRALVDKLAEVLPPYLDRPFALFGHSNGGLMAFELTRRLRADGRTLPQRLMVGGRPAPQVEIDEPNVHDLPEEEFRAALRRFGGTPQEVLEHEEIMSILGPVLRADFALGETYHYQPGPPLDLPISAYAGRVDAVVPVWQVEAWKEQTTREFRFREFPGGHFFIHEDRAEVTREVARELEEMLRAMPRYGG